MIIAIDGPAASGKGTIGARVASHLGLRYLDTGLLYRGVAAALLRSGHSLGDAEEAVRRAEELPISELDEGVLRAPEIGQAASKIAAMPEVRAALVARQRNFASEPPGAVLVGRDIGTTICPDATVKIFLTASIGSRAARRAAQLDVKTEAEHQQIRDGIEERDRRDTTRKAAPLRQAEDARLLDTTELDIEAAFLAALSIIEEAQKR